MTLDTMSLYWLLPEVSVSEVDILIVRMFAVAVHGFVYVIELYYTTHEEMLEEKERAFVLFVVSMSDIYKVSFT